MPEVKMTRDEHYALQVATYVLLRNNQSAQFHEAIEQLKNCINYTVFDEPQQEVNSL